MVPQHGGHVSIIEGWAHEPIPSGGPRAHLPAERSIPFIRIARCQKATWRRYQRREARQEVVVPIDAAAAARDAEGAGREGGDAANSAAVVSAVAGDVLPERGTRQQGREVSGIVRAVFEVLQEAVR